MTTTIPIRIAVFGGTGFLGRAFVDTVSARGHDVVVLSRREAAFSNATWRSCDAGARLDQGLLDGFDVVVNLIGIRGRIGTRAHRQDFETAHVNIVRNIIDACEASNVRRLVHVSVARGSEEHEDAQGNPSNYLRSKARGEDAVRHCALDWTILRPNIIWGEGDDFLSNLTKGIRHGPIFPLPAPGSGPIQPIHVDDVASCIAACLRDEATNGKTLDLVGPERETVSTYVHRISAVLGLATRVVILPLTLMRMIVVLFEAFMKDPPVTRAQLELLRRGVTGREDVVEKIIGRSPRALSVASMTLMDARGQLPRTPLFGLSLRTVRTRQSLAPIGQLSHRAHHLRWLAPVVIGVTLLSSYIPGDVPPLLRMLSAHALLLLPCMWLLRGTMKYLSAPSWRRVGGAITLFALMYAGGWVTVSGLEALAPDPVRAQLGEVYGFSDAFPTTFSLVAIGLAVMAEDIIFRGALLMPLLAMNRPALAIGVSTIAFTLAHLLIGPPILILGAFLAGGCWAWLAARTRSFVAPILAHLLWDLTVLWVAPY